MRESIGIGLFLSSLIVGLAVAVAWVVGANSGLLYWQGYGNPEWVDIVARTIPGIAFFLALIGLWLLYGGKTSNSRKALK